METKISSNSFQHTLWNFQILNSGILPSSDMDLLTQQLDLRVVPNLYYGKASATFHNSTKNVTVVIDPLEALSFVNFKKRQQKFIDPKSLKAGDVVDPASIFVLPAQVKNKHFQTWKNKQVDPSIELSAVQNTGDSFLCSPYRGTFKNMKSQITDQTIPVHLLTASNPIIWQDVLNLYDDQLDDNGLSKLDFRFRVMNDCFFGLLRQYLRVDDVIVRIYDTRIYHNFEQNYILRNFTIRENSAEQLRGKGYRFECVPNESFNVYPLMDLRLQINDRLVFL